MGLDFNSAKKNFKRILILYESVLQDLNVNRGNILHCTYREVDNTTNVKNMHLHRDSNPGPWNTVPYLPTNETVCSCAFQQ